MLQKIKQTIKPYYLLLKNKFNDVISWYYNQIGIQEKILSKIGKPKSIIFVCQGNICRSPFAEYYLKERLKEIGIMIDVSSAGIKAIENNPANPTAIDTALKLNVNLNDHRTQKFNQKSLNPSTLIIVFEKWHLNYIKNIPGYTRNKNSVILLGLIHPSQPHKNIPDPYGKNETVFIQVYQYIKETIENLITHLKNEI